MNETRCLDRRDTKEAKADAVTPTELSVTITTPPGQAAAVAKALNEFASEHLNFGLSDMSAPSGKPPASNEISFSLIFRGEPVSRSLQESSIAFGHDLEARLDFISSTVRCRTTADAVENAPPAAPKYWKTWVASMLGVYPLLILIYYALQPLTRDLPGPVSLFLVALVLTGVNGRFVAPYLVKRMRPWITR